MRGTSVGRAGGILSFWDKNRFISSSNWCLGGAIVVSGKWKVNGEEYCVINIYAPYNLDEKERLWDRLSVVMELNKEVNIYLIRDFNTILEEAERVGKGNNDSTKERQSFFVFVRRGSLRI